MTTNLENRPITEADDMKLKCNICVMIYGGAYSTDELYLQRIKKRDYLVCSAHRTHQRPKEAWYDRKQGRSNHE